MEPVPRDIRDRIAVTPERRAVTVDFHGTILASTTEALVLREKGYDPVYYIPREHVAMDFLRESDHRTRCPYKGEARYWSFTAQGYAAENGAWSYENPPNELIEITDRIAFDPGKVTIHLGGPEGE